MAYQDIRNDFIEGVNEVFTTLFNNASEGDGVYLYLLSSQRDTNVYGERKYKTYQEPILLTCQAILNPTYGEQTVEEIKDKAEFVVPLKAFLDKGIEVTHESLAEMRKGVLKFNDVIYIIDNIVPKAYVEDVFLMYRFICTEDIHRKVVVRLYKQEYSEDSSITGVESAVNISVSETVNDSNAVHVEGSVLNTVTDEFSEEQAVKQVTSNDTNTGMFTNLLDSALNNNEVQIPNVVDTVDKYGTSHIAYPTPDSYVGGNNL